MGEDKKPKSPRSFGLHAGSSVAITAISSQISLHGIHEPDLAAAL
jgi:hypothetical protein